MVKLAKKREYGSLPSITAAKQWVFPNRKTPEALLQHAAGKSAISCV
jgi:hypothetical protein